LRRSFNTIDFMYILMYLIKFTIDISQSFNEFELMNCELMNFLDILDAM